MFFNKKKKQAQLEQEQRAREEAAMERRKKERERRIEMGRLLLDRCPTYKFEVEYGELKEVLAAFPAEEYELEIILDRTYGCYNRYFIKKKNKEEEKQ